MMKAKLRDLIDAMVVQSSESAAYFNTATGQTLTFSEEEKGYVDEDLPLDDMPEWMQETADLAKDILESGNYLELPSQWDIDEYRIMSDFCRTQTSGDVQRRLLRAIESRGAFRRFKDEAFDLGEIEEWYAYRDRRYEEIAVDWCEEHNIEFQRQDP